MCLVVFVYYVHMWLKNWLFGALPLEYLLLSAVYYFLTSLNSVEIHFR